MRVAVVSDIHSNLHALEAVLAAIDAEAPDELWCLGDLVGYGAEPDACVETFTDYVSETVVECQIEPDLRIAAAEVVRAVPVGGGAPAVQQSGLGQQIGPRADAGHAPRARRLGAQPRRDGGDRRAPHVAAGDHQGVVGRRVQSLRHHGRARRALHEPGLGRQHADVVGPDGETVSDLERGDRAGGVEDLEAGEDQHAQTTAHG